MENLEALDSLIKKQRKAVRLLQDTLAQERQYLQNLINKRDTYNNLELPFDEVAKQANG